MSNELMTHTSTSESIHLVEGQKDAVHVVESCLSPSKKGDGGPTVWIGTNSGKVVSFAINVPPPNDRLTSPLICSPTGTV